MQPIREQLAQSGRRDTVRYPNTWTQVCGAEPAGTLHLTLNPVIDADPASPAAAVARSVLLIIARGRPRR